MIKLLGIEYLTDKEASQRFGFSQAWFIKERHKKTGPKYIKLQGKILYPIYETEQWFKNHIVSSEEDGA